MKKISIALLFILLGTYTLIWWNSGSHGNIQFRSHMIEDWILSSIVLICFAIPIILLYGYLKNKNLKD